MSFDFTVGFFGSLSLPQSECYLSYLGRNKKRWDPLICACFHYSWGHRANAIANGPLQKIQPNMFTHIYWAQLMFLCSRCAKLLTQFPQQSQILMSWVWACCGAVAFPKGIQTCFQAVFNTGWKVPALTFGQKHLLMNICISISSFSILWWVFPGAFSSILLRVSFSSSSSACMCVFV